MTIIVLNKKFSNCNYLLVPVPPPLGRLWWGCPRSSIQRPLWLVFVLFFDALSGWHPRWGTRRATSVAFMLRHTTTTDLQKKGYISLQNYNRDKDIKLHQGFFFSCISNFCMRNSNLRIQIWKTGKVLTSKNRAMPFFITNVL